MTSMADRAAEKVRVLLDLDRNEEAAEAARAGLQSDPNNAELLGLLAFALQSDGYSRQARNWAERSLSIDPRQAQVLDTRARAILDGAGRPEQAVKSASAAVKLAPTHAYYRHTLTRAQLAARQRDAAQATAESIRTIAPASPLGPLSEAIVEIDRAKYFEVRKVSLFWFALASAVTRGAVVIIWALVWLHKYFRRRGPLQRADAHLMEALRLDPGEAFTHSVAAGVARHRFRFIRAVDSTLALAAIDAQMVDPADLAREIVRRTTVIAAATSAVWLFLMLMLLGVTKHPVVIGTVGTVSVVAFAAGVGWLYEEQTKRLPPGVKRLVQRRRGLALTLLVIAAGLSLMAANNQLCVAIPMGVGAAILLAGFVVLIVQLVSARRIG
ncbi:tetratricopeptide repeat protein [Mycobacterium sp. NPDC051198]